MTIQCMWICISDRCVDKYQSCLLEKANQIDKCTSSVMAQKKNKNTYLSPRCSGLKQFYRQIFSNIPRKIICMLFKTVFQNIEKQESFPFHFYEVCITGYQNPTKTTYTHKSVVQSYLIINKTLAIQYTFKRIKHCAQVSQNAEWLVK